MFPLNFTRPRRHVAATIALVVVTILPTIYVGYTAWRIGRPSYLREVEREVGGPLGLKVSLSSVRYPRPGEVVYRGVVIRQEEPRRKGLKEIASANQVWIRRSDRELTVETDGLKIHGESPRLAIAQLGELLQKSSSEPAYERIVLSSPTLDLDLGAGIAPFELRDVVGDFFADQVVPTLKASYRHVVGDSSTRCELSLTRDRKSSPVRTTIALKTMEGPPLPGKVLDPLFDAVGWLGEDAKVEGTLTLRQDGAKDWEADFQGNLLDIDLGEVVAKRCPYHQIHGTARLGVTSAHWAERPGQGYGWVSVKGELNSGPGSIGFGLLNALNRERMFRSAPKVTRIVSSGSTNIDYRALAFAFTMTSDGEIQLRGGLGNEFADDVVMVSNNAPLAFAPEGAANVRGLIKSLVPVAAVDEGLLVPLTEKSKLLMALPVPRDIAADKPVGGN